MREDILNILAGVPDVETKFNVLREYLQCLVLKSIEEKGYIKNIAFVGGTALRFLYDLKRFSEDLDFSLVDPNKFDFDRFLNDLVLTFNNWNIDTELKTKSVKAVKNTFIKFPHLMFEGGISPRKEQKLFIKLEIDCNPPSGYQTELSFNQKYLPMNIFHYDVPSLYAGKLHAVLYRQYAKGRDFYDLMWFLGRKTEPNLTQLENAIFQTTGERVELNTEMLKEILLKRVEEIDFNVVREELYRFVANRDDIKYMTSETLRQLIKQAFSA